MGDDLSSPESKDWQDFFRCTHPSFLIELPQIDSAGGQGVSSNRPAVLPTKTIYEKCAYSNAAHGRVVWELFTLGVRRGVLMLGGGDAANLEYTDIYKNTADFVWCLPEPRRDGDLTVEHMDVM